MFHCELKVRVLQPHAFSLHSVQLVSPEVCYLSKTMVPNPGRGGNLCLIPSLCLFWDAKVQVFQLHLKLALRGPQQAPVQHHWAGMWLCIGACADLALKWSGFSCQAEEVVLLFSVILLLITTGSHQTLHWLWSLPSPLRSNFISSLHFFFFFWVCWSSLIRELGWSWAGWTSGTDGMRPAVGAWWRNLVTSPRDTRACPYCSCVPTSTQYF